MIVDACRRLERIAPLSSYGYVGFGALEFIDFDLFHRHLGIDRMISIERDSTAAERYEFNRPFRDIKLLFGDASLHLPSIDWTGLNVVWLDYVDQLRLAELRDCETVVRELQPGSVLIVTLNAHARFGQRLATLVENLEEERLPDLTEDDLVPEWSFAKVQRSVLTDHLQEVASLRPTPVRLRQFLNFHYRDQARMQTIGWIVGSPGLDKTIEECLIEKLTISRTGEEAMAVKLPVLTHREAQYLNARLPLLPGDSLDEKWLDQVAQAEYALLYRWYPTLV